MSKQGWLYPALTYLLGAGSAIAYVHDIMLGVAHPALVTWYVLVLSSVLTAWVVMKSTGRIDVHRNAALIVGGGGQTVILTASLYYDAGIEIAWFHWVVLMLSLAGFALFVATPQRALLSALIINGAVTIGFVPTWVKLWNGGISESLTAWVLITLAASIGIIPALKHGEYIKVVFPVRAALTGFSVVVGTLWNMHLLI